MTDDNFSRETILNVINDNLADYDADDVNSDYTWDDFFNDTFNSDYYIIGRKEAADALAKFDGSDWSNDYGDGMLDGIYGAIALIQEYELDNFGESHTDFSEPEKVANILAYILGEDVFDDILDNADVERDDSFKTNLTNVKREVKEDLTNVKHEVKEDSNHALSNDDLKAITDALISSEEKLQKHSTNR